MKSKAHTPAPLHPWTYHTWMEKQKTGWEYFRSWAKRESLSRDASLRLEWIIFYHTAGNQNISKTAMHFGIARKTLRLWLKRFQTSNVKSLEDTSKRPHTLRKWMVTQEEEHLIVSLRKQYMELGKTKLKILYKQQYGKSISTWKIEQVVRKHKLFQEKKKKRKYTIGKQKQPRIRIHTVKEQLAKLPKGVVWHTDSILIWWYGQRRIIFTALEDKTKLGFARVYTSASSQHGADFLKRLRYLSEDNLAIIHSDNGSEFAKTFSETCQQLHIQQIFSRPHTPKDNPALEKFNHTVQREWLGFSEVGLDDIQDANTDLTEWLVKYNSVRPHQALDYKTPPMLMSNTPNWYLSPQPNQHLVGIWYNIQRR